MLIGGKELNSVEEILKKENAQSIDIEIENIPIPERFDNCRTLIKEGFAKKNYADSFSSLLHQANTRLQYGTLTRPVYYGPYSGQFVCDVYIEGYFMGTGYDANQKQARVSLT